MKSSNIGGQAVMEGIMMRSGDQYSIGVRKPDGEIEVKVEPYRSWAKDSSIWKLPVFRGVASFFESLVVGIQCLMYSASFIEDEEEEDTGKPKKEKTEEQKEKEEKWLMYGTMTFSVIFSIALFIMLPYFLAGFLRNVTTSEGVIAVAEACVRMILFLGYLVLISRMKDIQRTFMYHGAEHKCINCVEHGLPLTVENVMASSRQHKRCGTSFLFLVMLVSICLHFVFVLVPGYWVRLFGRLLMVPVVSGISFEIIQWAGRTDTKFADMMSKPGLAMQKLTTKEPTADMVEVAIKAVEAVFDWKDYLKREFDWVDPEENNGEEHADI